MEQPPEPKRRRSQRLQEHSAAAEAGGSRGAQPAVSGSAAATAELAAPRPTPDGSTCSPFARILLPELLQRIASFMERNEVACSLRLVCTAAAAGLPGPRYTTVRLSEPSPPAVFEQQWSRPDALRSLNRKQREQLELLTARSGSIANLQTLAARGDLPLLYHSPQYWAPLLAGAARHGRLELCAWLRQQGAPVRKDVVAAAAEGGELAVVQCVVDASTQEAVYEGACAAAGHARVHVLDWLLGRMQPDAIDGYLLSDVAHGCTLDVLQGLHARYFARRQVHSLHRSDWLASAAGSSTPDWQEKVEWLEAIGCPRSSDACAAAAGESGLPARLQWLVGRGYILNEAAAFEAAESGKAEALQYVLERGFVQNVDFSGCMHDAARKDYLAVAQVLHGTAGAAITPAFVQAAAAGGHLPVVEWAAEQLGPAFELTADLFRAAASSGSWPLMRWLHERGCPWDATAFTAAHACSEEQLEWLVERGCPMENDGLAYVFAVCVPDLYALRCLRRLGRPFAADGSTFTLATAFTSHRFPDVVAPLLWLLDAGCPVDWAAARHAARDNIVLLSWLQEQQRRQRGGPVWEGRLRSSSRPGAR